MSRDYRNAIKSCWIIEHNFIKFANILPAENIGNFMFALMQVATDIDEFLQKNPEFPERKTLTEFYLNVRNFLNMYERVDEHYVVYSEHEADGRFKIKLFCVDPSLNLQECIERGNATIFFSAKIRSQYSTSLFNASSITGTS